MRSVRPFPPLLAAALLLGALYGAAAGCRSGTPAADPAAAALIDASYVGDEACESCHETLYADYHRTGMGRSVSRFDPATAPERFDADGRSPVVCNDQFGYCYQAFVRGDTLYQREFRPDSPGAERVYAVSHVVGSGNATRSYFMTVAAPGDTTGGYVTEMPLTWYVERAVWDLSPGYVRSNSRFERPIALECMTCHNGPPTLAAGTQNFYTDVPLGITCERCHGPGSAHVDARTESPDAGGQDGDPTVVNPARLSADLQLAVCQQCHLTGTTAYREGQSPTTYRPGTPLTANRRVFTSAERLEDPEAFGIASHAERLMRSACFIASQETARPMTCTTCHDPHRPNAELGPDHFNAACRSCHGADAHQPVCTRPDGGGGGAQGASSRAAAMTGDCAGCHLRRSGTSDIPHVSFTDHWIRRRPPAGVATDPNARPAPTALFELVDVTAREAEEAGRGRTDDGSPEEQMLRALATFRLYDAEHHVPGYLPQVVRLIRAARAGGVDHPDASLTLGRALLDMDSLASAGRALDAAVQEHPADAFAAYWQGALRLRRGDAAGADAALARSIELQPRFVEAYAKRSEALSALGRVDDAVAALTAGLRLNPIAYAGMWNDLGLIELQRGNVVAARPALERAVALDPRLVEAQANLAGALLTAGDNASAIRRLETALRITPDYTPALGNLGVAYMRVGRTADARRTFQRMVQLNPADAQARAYLQQLGG